VLPQIWWLLKWMAIRGFREYRRIYTPVIIGKGGVCGGCGLFSKPVYLA